MNKTKQKACRKMIVTGEQLTVALIQNIYSDIVFPGDRDIPKCLSVSGEAGDSSSTLESSPLLIGVWVWQHFGGNCRGLWMTCVLMSITADDWLRLGSSSFISRGAVWESVSRVWCHAGARWSTEGFNLSATVISTLCVCLSEERWAISIHEQCYFLPRSYLSGRRRKHPASISSQYKLIVIFVSWKLLKKKKKVDRSSVFSAGSIHPYLQNVYSVAHQSFRPAHCNVVSMYFHISALILGQII